MQAERPTGMMPQLYSLQGYYYGDLILAQRAAPGTRSPGGARSLTSPSALSARNPDGPWARLSASRIC